MTSRESFLSEGEKVSRDAGVFETLHGYFRLHADRLHHSCTLFGLMDRSLGDVLEIGPFFGYTPFLLRPRAASYRVIEGNDPAVQPLLSLYAAADIKCEFADLFELFGPVRTASHHLPADDAIFDTVICWETMEHFGFNPVKFVRELKRTLKPGGRACVTVPNRVSFQSTVGALFGRGETHRMEMFYQFEDYTSDGKKAFYGHHWNEYSPGELAYLFERAGFLIHACGTFTSFQNHGPVGAGRRLARAFNSVASRLMPRFGTNVYLEAVKPQ